MKQDAIRFTGNRSNYLYAGKVLPGGYRFVKSQVDVDDTEKKPP